MPEAAPIPGPVAAAESGAHPWKTWEWIALAAILMAILVARWRLLSVPFERDEGEYAYQAQLLLDGIPPYARAVSLKLPGMVIIDAICFAALGETVEAAGVALVLASLVTTALVYAIARRWFGPLAAPVTAAAF